MGILFFVWRVFEFAFFSLVHGTRLVFRALRRLVTGRGPTYAELIGLYLTELFESLGATFVKVGQVMSSRPDIFPDSITTPLKRLQDNVAPFNVAKIPLIVEQTFGKPLQEVFPEFETTPISSASVAHVHRAKLSDGRVVAVKIRRPGLLRKVKYDLLVLRLFTKILNVIPNMHLVALPEMVDEFGQAIYRQLDLSLEAQNNRRFRENFNGDTQVKIPELVEEYCSDAVLTMEFIENLQHISDIKNASKEIAARAARVGLHTIYKMTYTDGFVHADMHPGNVFFLEDGTFVILDVGLIAELNDYDFKNNTDFFFAMVSNNGKECARVIAESAPWRAPGFDRQAFEKEIVALIHKYHSVGIGDFEVSGFVSELFDIQRRHGVRMTPTFATTIIALIVFEGITKQLDPELDFQAEGRKFFAQAVSRRYMPPGAGARAS